MGTPLALDHINTHGEQNLDAGTLRHLHRFAKDACANDARIRAEVVAAGGEELAVAEWDSIFGQDRLDREEAMVRIEREFERRGIRL